MYKHGGVKNMDDKNLIEYFIQLASRHFPDGFNDVIIPPPVFISMGAEFLTIDPDKSIVEVKLPVPYSSLNPFGTMQGGIIAAAVDNAIGPLSMIVGPVSYTRDMELKYRKPVKGDFEYIIVRANLTDKKNRRLFFSAEVLDPDGNILITAKAMNWIVGG